MKSNTVFYSESVESFNQQTGLKAWTKIGHEVELEGNDTANEAYLYCKGKVKEWIEGTSAQSTTGLGTTSWNFPQPTAIIPLQSIDPKKRDETEIAIENAVTVEELYPLYEAAAANGIMWVYESKLRKFQ